MSQPDPNSPLARARRAAMVDSIKAAVKHGGAIWAFCTWCAHAQLLDAQQLGAGVKDPPNMLDELETRMRCKACKRHGVRLIPTDRTVVSWDRMGASRRDG